RGPPSSPPGRALRSAPMRRGGAPAPPLPLRGGGCGGRSARSARRSASLPQPEANPLLALLAAEHFVPLVHRRAGDVARGLLAHEEDLEDLAGLDRLEGELDPHPGHRTAVGA